MNKIRMENTDDLDADCWEGKGHALVQLGKMKRLKNAFLLLKSFVAANENSLFLSKCLKVNLYQLNQFKNRPDCRMNYTDQ